MSSRLSHPADRQRCYKFVDNGVACPLGGVRTHWHVGLALMLSGLLRSVQFTGLNSLAYYTVPKPEMASASTLQSIAQQVSIDFGVVLANLIVIGRAGRPSSRSMRSPAIR